MVGRLTTVATAMITATLLAASLSPAPAHAKWKRVTGIGGISAVNTDEIGLERTADGVLHVAWTRSAGGNADSLLHSAVSPGGGSVSGPDQIIGPPNNGINSSVDLVPGPAGGLRVLFAGLFPGTSIDLVMSQVTGGPGGGPWSTPGPVSNTGIGTAHKVYAASGLGGAVSPFGLAATAWGDSGPSEGGYHVGLSPLDPDIPFSPAAAEIDANVAFDSLSGAGYVAWNDVPGGNPDSLRVMPLAGGPVSKAPKSAAVWLRQRVSISGRIGAGGVFAAYGSGSNQFNARPAYWRIGAEKSKVVKQAKGAGQTSLAPAPAGRLWIFWESDGKVYAGRTNGKASKLGEVTKIKPPAGTSVVYRLNGEGSRGPLDVFALADAKGGLGYFVNRVYPGLSLTAKPKKVKAGKKATFLVSDAGDPVKGAKVILGLGKKKKAGKTNAKGKLKIKVPKKTKKGRYPAAASRKGYGKAKVKIRVS